MFGTQQSQQPPKGNQSSEINFHSSQPSQISGTPNQTSAPTQTADQQPQGLFDQKPTFFPSTTQPSPPPANPQPPRSPPRDQPQDAPNPLNQSHAPQQTPNPGERDTSRPIVRQIIPQRISDNTVKKAPDAFFSGINPPKANTTRFFDPPNTDTANNVSVGQAQSPQNPATVASNTPELKPVELKHDQRLQNLFPEDRNRPSSPPQSGNQHRDPTGLTTPPKEGRRQHVGQGDTNTVDDAETDFQRKINMIDQNLELIQGEIFANLPKSGILQPSEKGKDSTSSKRVNFDEQSISRSGKKEPENKPSKAPTTFFNNLKPPEQETREPVTEKPANTQSFAFFNKTVTADPPKQTTNNSQTLAADSEQIVNPSDSQTQPIQTQLQTGSPTPTQQSAISQLFSKTLLPASSTLTPPANLISPAAPSLQAQTPNPQPLPARQPQTPNLLPMQQPNLPKLTEENKAFTTLISKAKNTFNRNKEAVSYREQEYLKMRSQIGSYVDISKDLLRLQAVTSHQMEFQLQLEQSVKQNEEEQRIQATVTELEEKLSRVQEGISHAKVYLQNLKLMEQCVVAVTNSSSSSSTGPLTAKQQSTLNQLLQPRKYAPPTLSTYRYKGLFGKDGVGAFPPMESMSSRQQQRTNSSSLSWQQSMTGFSTSKPLTQNLSVTNTFIEQSTSSPSQTQSSSSGPPNSEVRLAEVWKTLQHISQNVDAAVQTVETSLNTQGDLQQDRHMWRRHIQTKWRTQQQQ